MKKIWHSLPYICIFVFSLYIIYSVNECMSDMDYFYNYPYNNTRDIRELRTILQTVRNDLSQEFSSSNIDFERINEILDKYYQRQDIIINDLIHNLSKQEEEYVPQMEKAINDLKIARQNTTRYVQENPDSHDIVGYYSSQIIPPLDRLNNSLLSISEANDSQAKRILTSFTHRHNAVEISTLLLTIFVLSFLFYHQWRDKAKNLAIAHREELFNILGKNIDNVFLIVNGDEKFEFVSSNSKRVLGVSSQEIMHNPDLLFNILGSTGGAWLKLHLHGAEKIEEMEIETDIGNQTKNFGLKIYPVIHQGFSNLKIAVISDQTQLLLRHKALQDALESSHRANQAKSSFLANMSHEIRTPLNVIMGLTTIAQARISEKHRVEDCLNKIQKSSSHLLGLINDVLDMSKIEGGKLLLNLEPFNIRKLVQDLINIIQPQALEKNQHFDVVMEDVEHDDLIGDVLRLRQILLNLLSNAIKFTPEKGFIVLGIQQIKSDKERVLVKFIVKDTGKGMSPDFLENVFDPFEQAHPGIAAKFGGSGLGLAITRNIVTLMNGTIHVQSIEGKGSEFSVELPLEINEKEEISHTPSLPKLKILVVNQDIKLCEQTGLILEKLGMRADWTNSLDGVQHKLQFAQENKDPFDICFIDDKLAKKEEFDPVHKLKVAFNEKPEFVLISVEDWLSLEKIKIQNNDYIQMDKLLFPSVIFDALNALSAPPQSEENNNKDTNIDFSGKRILLVEDNDFNREIATEFLEMVNIDVDHAVNGKDGIEKFMQSAPGYYDLILMDIQMPELNGYDATMKLRSLSHPDAEKIPVIAMTANAFDDDVANALASGMNSHISKPIDVDFLYRTLKNFLDGEFKT